MCMYYILLCGYTVVCIRISYDMSKRDLPDTYIYLSLRAAGLKARVYISGKSRLPML